MQAARQRGEREAYPPGGYGMSLFLSDWQRRWDGGKAVSPSIFYYVSYVALKKMVLICDTGLDDKKLQLALRVIRSNFSVFIVLNYLAVVFLTEDIVKKHSSQHPSIELHHLRTSVSEPLLHRPLFPL